MNIHIDIGNEERPELVAFLEERLYEFNSRTTGIFDGEFINTSLEDDSGNVVAAMSGHTWGGCCEVCQLWVDENLRCKGIGTAIMHVVEQEAVRRGCHELVLHTHSFQAPGFYEKLGFQRLAVVANYPKGHQKILYVKHLSSAN